MWARIVSESTSYCRDHQYRHQIATGCPWCEIERLTAENRDLRDFHDMVVNWHLRNAKTCFEIMDRCKKYEKPTGETQ